MKTKIFLCILLTALLFSCKKDEDDANELIGTWAENPSNEYFTYTFKSDGTGTWLINVNDKPWYFTYSFDPKSNKLTISEDGETGFCYVKFISKVSIQFFEDESYKNKYTEIMYKQ
jgi:hypothetical protein